MKPRGPLTLAALCLVPVPLWVASRPLGEMFADTTTSLTSIAVCLALVGTCSFALNLVLGARLAVVDRFFGGLDKMFRVHQLNGRVAYLLVLGHAIFIIASRIVTSADDALLLLTPAAGTTVFMGVLALTAMTIAIGLTLYVRLKHEMFVYVQRIFGLVFVLSSLHVFMTPGAKAGSAALTYYLAFVSAAGVAGFTYRSLFDDILVKRHDYQVTGVHPLDESVMEVVMAPVGRPLRFKPGQFLFVTFYSEGVHKELHPFSIESQGHSAVVSLRPGEIHEQFHPFSITSTPEDPELRVVFKDVGEYTHAMRSLDKGAWARVEGPYGGFSYLDVRNRRQIWVAGGIGITPFLSMARSLKDPDYEVVFFYSMVSLGRAYLLDEFSRIAAAQPNFKVIPYPEDEFGFLTADAIEERGGDISGKDILICGPPPMIDALLAQFSRRGISRDRIHFEKFGFAPR